MPHSNTSAELDKLLNDLYDYSNLSNIELNINTSYSGRGMYGKECVGFVTDNSLVFVMALTSYLTEQEGYESDTYPRWYDLNPQVDSMGLSSIVYFRNWQLAE